MDCGDGSGSCFCPCSTLLVSIWASSISLSPSPASLFSAPLDGCKLFPPAGGEEEEEEGVDGCFVVVPSGVTDTILGFFLVEVGVKPVLIPVCLRAGQSKKTVDKREEVREEKGKAYPSVSLEVSLAGHHWKAWQAEMTSLVM